MKDVFKKARGIAGIYGIRNLITGTIYIGRGIDIGISRWPSHLNDLRRNNHRLQRAWNKYTSINFEWIVIRDLTEEIGKLSRREANLVLDYNEWREAHLHKDLYNLIIPGAETMIPTEDVKDRISKPHSTPENIAKRSALMKNFLEDPEYKAMWLENFHSEESKRKQAETRATPEYKERWLSIFRDPEFKAKARRTYNETCLNEETKRKHDEGIRLAAKRPGAKEKRIAASKKNWLKPGYRERRLATIRKNREKRNGGIKIQEETISPSGRDS